MVPNDPNIHHRLEQAHASCQAALLAERCAEGFWPGELASSALSTATATSALALVVATAGHGLDPGPNLPDLVQQGVRWLAQSQNADGGWGDTAASLSNISTTMLVRAAFHLAGVAESHAAIVDRAAAYIEQAGGQGAMIARYGKDRTFAVPILANCALAGLADWRDVDPLPFELACLPHGLFRFLRLHVVSYALPALIAMGQLIHARRPGWNLFARLVRSISIEPSLRKLEAIQPTSGGFLEAVPLTSFVTMSLAAVGRANHPVARKAVEFLCQAVRADGSWPIDSNLSVWLTTLSINALASDGPADPSPQPSPQRGEGETLQSGRTPNTTAHHTVGVQALACGEQAKAWTPTTSPRCSTKNSSLWGEGWGEGSRGITLRDWLLAQQVTQVHPYTNAAPGGWGWSHLPGSVPDADDTAGALLALSRLGACDASTAAAEAGVRWLVDLQNSDGGWPTFCRGWGKLPFDRSGADLTAHALRALAAWSGSQHPAVMQRGLAYLAREQRPDGSWIPLWFGNEHAPDETNPTYGTARVLKAYAALRLTETDQSRRGVDWLVRTQNSDGGWGGAAATPSTVEETALAVEALADIQVVGSTTAVNHQNTAMNQAMLGGVQWLLERIESGAWRKPSPIGFYFARLWYHERLYPLIFTVAALGRARRAMSVETAPAETQPRSPN
jgi:squalene-hopene/tetraprenyl-beta-curcumene cyclase